MITYENILFNGKIKKKQEADKESNPQNWHMSAYECILNSMFSFFR